MRSIASTTRIATARLALAGVSAFGLMAASGALAQTKTAAAESDNAIQEIVVTAQRSSQGLQSVPIAVSAFTAEGLEKQQIHNASDLQLTLPNITFTKDNFTGSSFTIRGIGDLCVGSTCDSATAIHSNDMPLFATRLFETEYFDLERVEVLRGPQGTLFGRNATAGVVNFITAKPDLKGMHAAAEAEYGNYNTVKLKGMFNLPVTDRLGVRVAGYYTKRDGYTTNLYDNSKIDDRDMYALRGSLRWEPTDNTTVDLMGYYFHEKDNRMRIQKQLCQRDPTGVLGCLPGRLDYGTTNANSTFVGTLSSKELLRIQGGAALGGALSALGLGSLYGPDVYANAVNPADPRVVNTDYTPTYFTDELQVQAKIEHDFGAIKVKASGQYMRSNVDSSQDYNSSVQDRSVMAPGLNTLALYASGAAGAALANFAPVAAALIPKGVNGVLCTSLPETTGTGVYGGHALCANTPEDFDRSNSITRAYTGEGIISSQFDGKFNFLIGGIYNDIKSTDTDYYVDSFGIDYVTGVLGVASALGAGAPNSYLGTPTYRNNSHEYTLKSYGLFGEAYFDLTDRIKITAGIRYNHDEKNVQARTTLANFLVPFGSTNAYASPFISSFDADPGRTGNQLWQYRTVSFGEWTGRAVIDFKITDDSLLYASYSRGYKSGGINPPLSPVFAVAEGFEPEFVDSFEVGSKNTFLEGRLRLNLTGFYYKYKGLQLSRIVARTSVNDNVDANIYGLEAEAILQPVRGLAINFGASYLHTEVANDKFLANTRDPSGGRSDAVIIKDISNGANCAVVPNAQSATSAAVANGYVTAVNAALGLKGPTAFPTDSGINGATGAFSICSVLSGNAAAAGLSVLSPGVTTNIKGNTLPQAPEFKFSAGVQYTLEMNNGMSITPRWDLAVTGDSYGNIVNGYINRVASYYVMNAQIQLNGADDRWFLRGYIQNITDNNATTGLYVTDQSSGNFTNIFTLEPRRYGVTAGFKF